MRVPAFKNTTKIPREDPERERKRTKMGGGDGKKSEILGHPAEEGPAEGGPGQGVGGKVVQGRGVQGRAVRDRRVQGRGVQGRCYRPKKRGLKNKIVPSNIWPGLKKHMAWDSKTQPQTTKLA